MLICIIRPLCIGRFGGALWVWALLIRPRENAPQSGRIGPPPLHRQVDTGGRSNLQSRGEGHRDRGYRGARRGTGARRGRIEEHAMNGCRKELTDAELDGPFADAPAFPFDSAHRKKKPSVSGDRSICTSRRPASVSAALPVRGACLQDSACTSCVQVTDPGWYSSCIRRAAISGGRATCVLLRAYRFALIL